MRVKDIMVSLRRRGFLKIQDGGSSVEDIEAQVMAVQEELGEVARLLRRHRQGKPVNLADLMKESIDVLISSTCLAANVCGTATETELAAKLAADEQRGYLHQGGPLLP